MADLREAFSMLNKTPETHKVSSRVKLTRCDSCGNTKTFITSNDGNVTQICGVCGRKYYFPQNAV